MSKLVDDGLERANQVAASYSRTPNEFPENDILVDEDFSAGMISQLDPADLPQKSVKDAKNIRIYLDKLFPAPGYNANILPTKPNTNKVLKVISFQKNDKSSYTYRFDKASLYKLGSGTWDLAAGALTGGDLDRITAAIAFDIPIFTNNAIDYIQAINTGANSFARLGNAPKAKFVTTFYNRVIALCLDGNPISISTSGDANITEFNPAVDLSAYTTPLIEVPGDLNDFITGGFGFADTLVVLRQKSIWNGTRTATPEQPIYFTSDVSGIGCGLPYTACVCSNNQIVFADHRKKGVFLYTPGSRQVREIGILNRDAIFSSITDTDAPFASYDPALDRYHLCIPSASTSTVIRWIYDFKTQSWTREEIENLSSLDYMEGTGYKLKISQLQGKVSSLVSTISTLGVINVPIPTDFEGYANGNVAQEDTSISTVSELISKTHTDRNSRNSIAANKFRFDMNIKDSITVELQVSKNDGITWKRMKRKTLEPEAKKIPIIFSCNKLVVASRLSWKLIITGKNWELINHVIEHSPSGTGSPSR